MLPLDMAQASKISLFLPKGTFRSCHLPLTRFSFQTTAAPVPPSSLLDPSHQIMKSAVSFLTRIIAWFFSSMAIFPGNVAFDAPRVGSIPSAGSILDFTETCLASYWP